jgi:hypothetical protein
MIARRSPLLAGALVCGALIAGCGSSSSSSTSGSTATTSSSAAAATTSTPTTSAKSTAPSTGVSPADLAAAVAECKAVVQHSTTLSSSLKSKVEGICNKAARGNVAAARAAAKEVCVEVIKATPVPAADKEQALAACKTS